METSVEIQPPASDARQLLTDTLRWVQWGPSFSNVESAKPFIGLGSSGRMQTFIGVWLSFQITEFVAGQRWGWEIAGIPASGLSRVAV